MFAEEWPLMLFTFLSQLAIGTFIMLTLAQTLLSGKDEALAVKIVRPGLTAAGPLMAVALLLSLFHLGKPFSAPLSILNLGTSWLSREIFTAGAFFVLWLVCFYLMRKGKRSAAVSWAAAIFGLLAVISMAGIYSTSIRPAWTSANTYIVFLSTTFVLGVLGATASIVLALGNTSVSAEVAAVFKKLGLIAAAAVLIPLLYLPVYISGLGAGGEAGLASISLISGYGFQIILRWLLTVAGLGLLFHVLYKQIKASGPVPMPAVCGALGLIIAGEFLGRYLFYAIAVSITIG